VYHAETKKQKLKLLLYILWPILITQIGYNAMSLFDTIMSGQYGEDDLAGVAIGANLWLPAFVSINGLLLAIAPIVSQLVGAKKEGEIAPTIMQALYLSAAISAVLIVFGIFLVEPIFTFMDLDPEVHHIAKHFLIGLSFGIIPLFMSSVLRYFFDGQGYTRITMFIVLIGVPFNIALNYMLIYGKFGFPELGGIGSGYATAITYWLIFGISVVMTFGFKSMRKHRLFLKWPKPSMSMWLKILKIGVPIGLAVFFEASIFSLVTLFMGSKFDKITVGAHQTAVSWSGMMFMIPLSIANALTILVSFEIGAKRVEHAKQYGRMGLIGAVGIISVLAVIVYFTRDIIASWYTNSTEVAIMAQQFLIYVIFFQFSDSAQAALQGTLRGYKDVTVPFYIALVSYWIIGIPLGYALTEWTNLGQYGFWVGIIAGLTFSAIGFFVRLLYVERKVVPKLLQS